MDGNVDFSLLPIIKEEKIDNKYYTYYEGGYYEIDEKDENGNRIESYYNSDNVCVELYTCDSSGNSKYYKGDVLISDHVVYSEKEGYYKDTSYNKDGSLRNISEKTADYYLKTDYSYDDNKQLTEITSTREFAGSPIKKISRSSKYDSGRLSHLETTEYYNGKMISKLTEDYSGPKTHKELLQDGKIQYSNDYVDDVMTKSREYEYYPDGNRKKTIVTNYQSDSRNICTYTYDSNVTTISNDFYDMDGNLIFHTDCDDVQIHTDGESGNYDFIINKNNKSISYFVKKNGERFYQFADSKAQTVSRLELRSDGTYFSSVLSTNKDDKYANASQMISQGVYQIDENGNIICTDNGGAKYTYDSAYTLIRQEKDGKIIEYDVSKGSQTVSKNGKTTYSRINHIEYDEETYDALMKTMVEIYDNYPEFINNNYQNTESLIQNLPDQYSIDNLSNVYDVIQDNILKIDNLKEMVNYSLLAYMTCDNSLKEKANYLIDSLFDDNEKRLANVFKYRLWEYTIDADRDGILEYKKETNFDYLYSSLIPESKYSDKDGNIWYTNNDNEIICVEGENPKITYGGEEFFVKMTKNGVFRLIDSNGNPLSIYGDYNTSSYQYGGNQEVFGIDLLKTNPYLGEILQTYFSDSSTEEKVAYLDCVRNTGCGDVAMSNAIFDELKGQEDRFYDLFGFPMYSLKPHYSYDGTIQEMTISGVEVDYNYEPVILDLFCQINNSEDDVLLSTRDALGTYDIEYYQLYKYVHNKYGLFDDNYNEFIANSGLFGDDGYNIYSQDSISMLNGGSHAMIKTGEAEDDKWIVSSWGQKCTLEPNNPRIPKKP